MSPKVIIIGFLGIMILVVGVSFLLTTGQKPDPKIASYSSQSPDRPKAETGQISFDFGSMKSSDVRQNDFTLKNSGSRPLQITNVNSSCGCTFAQVIYKGQTSKEFGMHSQSGYVTDIAPGDTATIRVIYKPYIMPVYGAIEREVYIETNDPQNSKIVYSVKANVS